MPVDLVELGVFGDLLGFLGSALAGWRYLFSPSYRQRVHLRWQSKSGLQVAQEVAAAIAGSLLWLVVLWVVISFLAGFDWMERLSHGTSSV